MTCARRATAPAGTPTERRENGRAIVTPPPLHLELTYAVTAWTKAVEDEHRLLSQVLAILFSYGGCPRTCSATARPRRSHCAEAFVGRPREEKADFWTSVGGQYKASIDYIVHITVESGAMFVRGPEVRTQTVRVRQADGPASAMEELHRLGGTIRDGDGLPAAAVWIALPDAGLWAASDARGRFTFSACGPGPTACWRARPTAARCRRPSRCPAAPISCSAATARGRVRGGEPPPSPDAVYEFASTNGGHGGPCCTGGSIARETACRGRDGCALPVASPRLCCHRSARRGATCPRT